MSYRTGFFSPATDLHCLDLPGVRTIKPGTGNSVSWGGRFRREMTNEAYGPWGRPWFLPRKTNSTASYEGKLRRCWDSRSHRPFTNHGSLNEGPHESSNMHLHGAMEKRRLSWAENPSPRLAAGGRSKDRPLDKSPGPPPATTLPETLPAFCKRLSRDT